MERKKALQIDISEIKKKSVVGVLTLTSRTFVLQVIAFISTFILTILLDPTVFGIFFVVTAVVNFLNYFSDIGLAAALIQKKAEPTRDDLVTTFTIQQLLVGMVVILSLLLSQQINNFYRLGQGGLFVFQALIISFFLSSLKTIPSILLERKLDFKKLIIPQILETLVFYAVAILLAVKGMGVVSFGWAALCRGIVGLIAIYIFSPWMPGIYIRKKSAISLLHFGLPFQTNSFLALIKDDLLTIVLGKILPLAHIGYIGWAKKWSEIALRLIMDNIIKVTFPAFSRLQHDKKLLARAIERSLLFLSLLSLPIGIGMVFLIKPFIEIIPKYGKWEPALYTFYLFTFSAMLATLSSPLFNALNALGKVKQTFGLMIMWTVLTWILTPVCVSLFGFVGVGVAATLISFTSFMPYFVLRKSVKFSFWGQLGKPILATIAMAFGLFIVSLLTTNLTAKLIVSLLTGIIIYSLAAFTLMKEDILNYVKLVYKR